MIKFYNEYEKRVCYMGARYKKNINYLLFRVKKLTNN